MFEPVHGSAPDIAGRESPTHWADMVGAMMLRHLGASEAADAVEKAITEVLAQSKIRTLTSAARPRPRSWEQRSPHG